MDGSDGRLSDRQLPPRFSTRGRPPGDAVCLIEPTGFSCAQRSVGLRSPFGFRTPR
jgi:hypothetical protein